jgi:glycosyltransferase involved in cell wall biosynthesis
MKIVHLTSVHPRYDTRVFLKECRSLAAVDNDVTLIVADGKGSEMRDGVRILDVGKPSGRARRMVRTVRKMYKVAKRLDADIYHMHDPELLQIAGKLSHLKKGVRVVFDAHEDLPRQVLSKEWIPKPLRRITSLGVELVENQCVRKLSGVIAATPYIADRFRSINAEVVDINNYPISDELVPIDNGRFVSRKRICYIGGITEVRGLKPLICALPMVPDTTLVLCGSFQVKEFEAEMRSLPGWAQVDYRGQLDRSGVRKALEESSIGIVTLLPTPAYIDALPVKLFEYMSAGLPVIASNFPLWRRIIDDAGAGLCVDPESPKAIAQAIGNLLESPSEALRMGRAGRKAILEKYNWAREAAKLFSFYKRLHQLGDY